MVPDDDGCRESSDIADKKLEYYHKKDVMKYDRQES